MSSRRITGRADTDNIFNYTTTLLYCNNYNYSIIIIVIIIMAQQPPVGQGLHIIEA